MIIPDRSAALFRHGQVDGREDRPVLLAMCGEAQDDQKLIRYCRRICAGASILAPVLAAPHAEVLAQDPVIADHDAAVDGVATWVASSRAGDLSGLRPVVAVGHGPGANLAMRLAVRHDALLAAVVLLRPARLDVAVREHGLDGLNVLLATASTTGWEAALWRHSLAVAGAQVVHERVADAFTPGARDAAIARVFLATLFGT